jgi:hypothetical protein
METESFYKYFRKTVKYQISWKFRPVGNRCSMRKDERTDMNLSVILRDFANAPKNSTFRPHSIFVCIWEQTAIISLYSINWLVFITETECVYCAVLSSHTV